jgi:lipopolysaccharide/colanic/teichoic acid biosynthesis glycosyltransferase
MSRRTRYDQLKRAFDVGVGGSALVLSLPVQALVALLLALAQGRPVLFRQQRPGKDGQIFEVVKFRSMREPDPSRGLISDGDRITRVGAFVRSTSLDELPTLWNVVRGDMSVVGPRPLLPEYLPHYTAEQMRRHEVRPGVTGLAQVHGRNLLDWESRLRLDVHYVDHRSLRLDVSIIASTVALLLKRTGVSAEGHATMPKFPGSTQAPR